MLNNRSIKTWIKTSISTGFLTVFLASTSFGQNTNWQNQDLKQDGIFGISTEKAYQQLLKGKKAKPVIVAVIDAGVDYNHEDLKDVVWKNLREIAGNGKDDDKNGYIDDVYGWNFLGSAKGSVAFDNTELARIVKSNPNSPLKDTLDKKIAESRMMINNVSGFARVVDTITTMMGNPDPDLNRLKDFVPKTSAQERVQRAMLNMLSAPGGSYAGIKKEISETLSHFEGELKYNYNVDYNSRDTVGDDLNNLNERKYGNNAVSAYDCLHGTHVAGIIAAKRGNGLGIDGIADQVKILPVRAVPNGDERDKDIANAIYYAVDNGAKVINMSFGKYYSPQKDAVDKAVAYAVAHDVLLIKAAGNDGIDLDQKKSYPYVIYDDGKDARSNWITVGASGWQDNAELAADFSNYGKTEVDLFAPGVDINSTLPGSKYQKESGTSMAAPVVSGIAALVRAYYPKLKAPQVKEIILKSVTKVDHNVKVPGKADTERQFSELCVTGGIANAYNALELAAKFKK